MRASLFVHQQRGDGEGVLKHELALATARRLGEMAQSGSTPLSAFVPQGQIEEYRRGNGSKVDPDPDIARDAGLTEAPVERGAQVAQMLAIEAARPAGSRRMSSAAE